jgi:hypothetical protein
MVAWLQPGDAVGFGSHSARTLAILASTSADSKTKAGAASSRRSAGSWKSSSAGSRERDEKKYRHHFCGSDGCESSLPGRGAVGGGVAKGSCGGTSAPMSSQPGGGRAGAGCTC